MATYFPSTLTPGADAADTGTYMMFTRFKTSVNVTPVGIRFYAPSAISSSGAGIYAVGAADGNPLVSKTGSLVVGWNEFLFDTPVELTAAGDYLAGVLLPDATSPKYTALAGVTVPHEEGDWSSHVSGIGGYMPGATSLVLPNNPTVGEINPGTTWYGVELIVSNDVEVLDTPIVTIVAENDPTVAGNDGSIQISWPAVDGAHHYDVGIASGHGQTSGFSVVDEQVSPYTFTGLTAGNYTVAVRAVPTGD